MYDGIKKAIGPVQRMISSSKSSTEEILTWNKEKMERFVEHYSNIYSCQNIVSENSFNSLEWMSSTIEELYSAIDHLTNDKAAGSESISLDLIKTFESALLLPLHEIICQS